MSETLCLYDLLDSPLCLKARICLTLKQVPYQRVDMRLSRRRELRRLNAPWKVPVLVAGKEMIADSDRIARCLEERFPHPRLLPRDAAQAAYCHLLEEWAGESLFFAIGAMKWLNPRNREAAYNAAEELDGPLPKRLSFYLMRRHMQRRYGTRGIRAGDLPYLEARLGENLAALRDLLGDKPFLLGKFVTLADLAVFVQLRFLSGFEEKRLLDAVPGVRSWMEQLAALEPIQQAIRGEAPSAPIVLENEDVTASS